MNTLAYNKIYTVKTSDLFILFIINGKYLAADKEYNGYLLHEFDKKIYFDDLMELLDFVDARIRTEDQQSTYWN